MEEPRFVGFGEAIWKESQAWGRVIQQIHVDRMIDRGIFHDDVEFPAALGANLGKASPAE